jgi:hypothetical protein
MATAYKTLGQVIPAATTLTTLYTVPGATSAVISTLCICNQGVSTTYRVSVRVAAAADTPKQYLIYDATLNQYDTALLTLGISLGAADIVSVYAGTANVSFNLFGGELT